MDQRDSMLHSMNILNQQVTSRLEMYIKCIGNDVDPRGNILTGSVLIDKMTVAGK